MKNDLKEMFRNPNSSKSDDSDCCKEYNECYCVTKQECDWINCPIFEKWLHENCTVFSKPAPFMDAKAVLSILENVRNVQRSKKETHSDTE